MRVLPVLIRQQTIAIAVLGQQLHALRHCQDAIAGELARAREESSAVQEYLRQQLGSGSELAVERLLLAQACLGEQQGRVGQLEARLALIDEQCAAADRQAAHAQKRLEKLEELALRAGRERREAADQREWQVLDEWVLNAFGRTA